MIIFVSELNFIVMKNFVSLKRTDNGHVVLVNLENIHFVDLEDDALVISFGPSYPTLRVELDDTFIKKLE